MNGLLRVALAVALPVMGAGVVAAQPAAKAGKARRGAEPPDAAAQGQPGIIDAPKQSIEGTMYVPPKAGKVELPVYPYDLLRQRIAGEASVSCMVNTRGMVINTRVMKATRPEFGAALAAALEATKFGYAAAHAVAQWRFEPPTAHGAPTVMRVAIPFTFRVN